MAKLRYRVEAVYWDDHCTSASWQEVTPKTAALIPCLSIGLVVQETKDVLVLAGTISEDGQVGNVMKRGKKLITKRKFIEWFYP